MLTVCPVGGLTRLLTVVMKDGNVSILLMGRGEYVMEIILWVVTLVVSSVLVLFLLGGYMTYSLRKAAGDAAQLTFVTTGMVFYDNRLAGKTHAQACEFMHTDLLPGGTSDTEPTIMFLISAVYAFPVDLSEKQLIRKLDTAWGELLVNSVSKHP